MNINEEINDYPEPISLEGTKIILEQMENKVCKIAIEKKFKGIGYFCKIPFPDQNNLLPVLITNNHIINNELIINNNKIKLNINNEYREIKLKHRKYYTNEEYDITIIEIKEKDKIKNYLELDENINKDISYIGKSIYIIHYKEDKDIYVSYGNIKEIEKEYIFKYLCKIEKNSFCSPILNISNNKIIGIYKKVEKENDYNIGLFIKYGINEFLKKNLKVLDIFVKFHFLIKIIYYQY